MCSCENLSSPSQSKQSLVPLPVCLILAQINFVYQSRRDYPAGQQMDFIGHDLPMNSSLISPKA